MREACELERAREIGCDIPNSDRWDEFDDVECDLDSDLLKTSYVLIINLVPLIALSICLPFGLLWNNTWRLVVRKVILWTPSVPLILAQMLVRAVVFTQARLRYSSVTSWQRRTPRRSLQSHPKDPAGGTGVLPTRGAAGSRRCPSTCHHRALGCRAQITQTWAKALRPQSPSSTSDWRETARTPDGRTADGGRWCAQTRTLTSFSLSP